MILYSTTLLALLALLCATGWLTAAADARHWRRVAVRQAGLTHDALGAWADHTARRIELQRRELAAPGATRPN